MLSKQVLIAACTLFLLTAMFVPWEALGQEGDVTLELLWEKTLDSPIRYRVMNEWILDVGIDTTVSEDENPVCMVTTERSIYIFDKQGKTISQIPLKAKKPDEIADKEKGNIIREQRGTVSPNGQYYAIAEIFIAYEEFKYGEVSVFNQGGNLQFKIKGGGMPYFSPNGKYLILFYESPYFGDARIQFYDLEGNLRKAID
ncbi:MAG: hypothetical protein J7M27_14990, partial [Candidatus Latescibacteria bacterium]|nr:hypothetical protein [Candidatus Latescibacterota bacterium]